MFGRMMGGLLNETRPHTLMKFTVHLLALMERKTLSQNLLAQHAARKFDMTDKPKRPRDANQLAKFIVDVATATEEAKPLGRDQPKQLDAAKHRQEAKLSFRRP